MLMADVMLWTLVIVGFCLAQQGLWLLCRALWPGRLAAATERCNRRPVVSFLVGLPVTAAAMAAVAVAGNALGAVGQALAFAGFIAFWVYANLGTAAFATYVGQRLTSPADLARPWAATVRGGVALELAWLVPVVGWLGVFPVSIVLGTGAVTLAMFSRRRGAEAQAPTVGAVAAQRPGVDSTGQSARFDAADSPAAIAAPPPLPMGYAGAPGNWSPSAQPAEATR